MKKLRISKYRDALSLNLCKILVKKYERASVEVLWLLSLMWLMTDTAE